MIFGYSRKRFQVSGDLMLILDNFIVFFFFDHHEWLIMYNMCVMELNLEFLPPLFTFSVVTPFE